MHRYKLTLEYDGTEFHGWQKQFRTECTDGARILEPISDDERLELRTVQSVLERAVRGVIREPIELMGASRTDAGVHARGQVAAFTSNPSEETGSGWPLSRGVEPLRRAINSRLPGDVLVRSIEPVDAGFDPISGALSKGYSYTFHTGADRPVFGRRFVTHAQHELDPAPMREAAALLVGEHDFAGFCAAGHGRATTVRTIFACDVSAPDASNLRLNVSGNGFLWNMVRIIAGTLYDVGRGRIELDRVREALTTGDRRLAGTTLGPEGLCLEWIRYE